MNDYHVFSLSSIDGEVTDHGFKTTMGT
jgi:hypothetical protein